METLSPCDPAPWRDARAMRGLLDKIAARVSRPWSIMEVCGGQTWTLSRYRLETLLPPEVRMIHGPGCPVCVTPAEVVDAAVTIAMRPEVILCSFGDMLRVPGTSGSLLRAKAGGADVRLLYTPLEALTIARDNPGRQVVFLAIGFETTTPVYALLLEKARKLGVENLSVITSLFTVPPAVEALRADPDCRIDALLAAGHVCAVTGLEPYHDLARSLAMPVVVTGFEPVDMLLGILRAVEMLEDGASGVDNAYGRVVSHDGAVAARQAVERVFEPTDNLWRGLGLIPRGGMKLRPDFEQFDALKRFNVSTPVSAVASPSEVCRAHLIMKGLEQPADCPCFGRQCTPDNPVGAPMVSAEGVCAAHYRYNN
ncbi:MAG: hydrogenase formation protein HypD [Bacteroidales bacterium]|nr:hydrogenase formation protein HypD [Bacteroidales bacterium]MBD5378111.1 hydrogenase formation protein HypD [Bacteroides sp.]